MTRILLAYSPSNADLAATLTADLGRVGLPFDHITCLPHDTPGDFAVRLLQDEEPVLLLVTDNLLRSTQCMSGLLEAVRHLHRHRLLMPVVADGKNAQGEAVPTHIDRMVNALQYMNHWQNDWLTISTQYQQASGAAKAALETELDLHRTIANEVGDFIGLLREAGAVEWPQFSQQGYAALFERFGLHAWHEQYLSLQAPALPTIQQEDNSAPHTTVDFLTENHPLAPSTVPDLLLPVPMPQPSPATQEEPVRQSKPVSQVSDFTEKISDFIEKKDVRIESQPPGQEPLPTDAQAFDALPNTLLSEPTPLPESDVNDMIRDAWFWVNQGREEHGMELFELAIEQYPDHPELRAQYQAAQAQAAARHTAQPQPAEVPAPTPPSATGREEAKSYELMGDMAADKGDYLFAKYCWDRSAEIDPQLPGLYRKLGLMTYEHLRDYKETAIVYLQKALDTEPDDAAVMLALADNAVQTGQPDEAAQFYTRAVAHAPHLRSPEYDRLFLKTSDSPTLPPHAEPALPRTAPEATQPATTAPASAKPQREVLTVLITGATSGIGRATAEEFARHGHRLLLAGRRTDRLSQINRELQDKYGTDVLLLPFDVRNRDTVQHIFESLPSAWRDIDVLLNNAGLAKGLAPVHEGNLDHWETMIDTNLKGVLYVTRAVAPGMVRRRRGHIINISSSAGKEAYAQGSVYCATKFAIEALTRAIRLDLHKHNIRVSQVSPGHVEETEFALTRFDGDAERARIYDDFQPLKARDVAEAIYFIATRPAHVNIQDIWMFGTQQASATVIDRSGRAQGGFADGGLE